MRRFSGLSLIATMSCVLVLCGCQAFNEKVLPCVKQGQGDVGLETHEGPQDRTYTAGTASFGFRFGGQGCPEEKEIPVPSTPPDDETPIPYPGREDEDGNDSEAMLSAIGQGVIGTIADLRIEFPWIDVYSVDVGWNGITVKFGGTTDSYTTEYDLQRGIQMAQDAGFNTTVTRTYSQDLIIPTNDH